MASLDPRQLGSLKKCIISSGNPIVFPTATELSKSGLGAPASANNKLVTAIIRPLSADVILDVVQLKYDIVPGTIYNAVTLATGCELLGVIAGTVSTGLVEVFFSTGQ